MVWGQEELFPSANEVEVQRTKFLLSKYTEMVSLMRDFEAYEPVMIQVAVDGEAARRIDQEDLHADKIANAAILVEKQRWVYKQYKFYTTQIRRACGLIQDKRLNRRLITVICRATRLKRLFYYFGTA
ncbi:hypothetical protein PAPH110629_14870 [Paenibacillus phoenicis]